MYAIVQFEEEQVLEVVPQIWVQGSTCRWPDHLRGTAIKAAIEQKKAPQGDWGTYNVIVERGRGQ